MSTLATPPAADAQASINDVPGYCRGLGERALAASRLLATSSGAARNAALHAIAEAIEADADGLREANGIDLEAGRGAGLAPAMLDRLELTPKRLKSMADGCRQVAMQPDPVGRVLDGRVLDSGIRLQKLAVPIGVVLIIFESRPNVTADAAALCLKAGDAAILRGGKEAVNSNARIADCVRKGLQAAGLPGDAVQLVGTTDRAAVGELLQLEGLIDVAIPRGGESLIRAVVQQARIPVIKHYTGNCHLYLHADADPAMARAIAVNAKTQRPGVCNAAETLLVHADLVDSGVLREVLADLVDAGVSLRCDERAAAAGDGVQSIEAATDDDWATEYLELTLAVKVVDSLDEAVDHINRYGSRHTDAIVTQGVAPADAFVQRVDSANVFVNCSTRFSDGQRYGLGAEIGISTDKLHARGPMGADDLTTYKWVARGEGQIVE
jgi:glutamate-5-semialdehyde dehydrogenase